MDPIASMTIMDVMVLIAVISTIWIMDVIVIIN